MTAIRNDRLIRSLRGEFVPRYSPGHAWAYAPSMHLMLPGLIAFYSGAVNRVSSGSGEAADVVSGLNLVLQGNAKVRPEGTNRPLPSYFDFDGAGDYASLTDAAAISLTGTETFINAGDRGITIGCWVYHAQDSTTEGTEHILAKWNTSGDNRSYLLLRHADGSYRFSVSSDGTSGGVSTVSKNGYDENAVWRWVVGRFDPSIELEVFVDAVSDSNTTSIAASTYDGTADLTMGSSHGETSPLNGSIALPFLCAAIVPDIFLELLYEMTAPMFKSAI